ncbi:WXG100 family type VII secretion target [Nocardia colli]|uniref:WXG100 family type VII secretion target n=1 Tax=Nocardia colli TaxID=2545717 RepID=UPI0035DE3891
MRKLPRTPERLLARHNDPAYAPNVEVFDNLTHQEIHDKVQLLNPAVLTGGQQAWGDAAAGLAEAISQAHIEIRADIADGWRGSAAQQAVEAVYGFEQTGQDLADVLAVVSQRLGQAGDAAEALRAAVSAPSGKAPDLGAALLDPTQATSNVVDQKTTEHTRQDIVRSMNDIYAGVFIPTGNNVPAFLDEQFGDAPAAPNGSPAAKLTGPGIDAGTPVAQQIPAQAPAAATQPVEAQAADAPAAEQAMPDEQQPAETQPATVAASSAVTDAGSPATPAAPRVTAAAADTPLSLVPSATRPHIAPASAAAAPSTTTASTAQPLSVPGTPGTVGAGTPDEQRKREERRTNSPSTGDAVTGLGAGAMGGLMGGAMAVGDAPRQGSSVAASAAANARAPRFDDEDEDDFHFDDLPTYLEPADDNGELIGAIDPTTPPVLGEWTELE